MRKLCVALVLTLPASAVAQAYVTAPSGFLDRSGAYQTTYPFWLLKGRYQNGDPTFKRGTLMALLSLDFRTSTAVTYTARNSAVRSYSQLTLTLADCNCAKFGKVYTQNYIGKGTLVFKGKYTTPTITLGKPRQVWGNAGTLAFSKPYLYSGKHHMLQDWTYDGGKLVNGHVPKDSYSHSYFVDGVFCSPSTVYDLSPESITAPGSRWVPRNPVTLRGGACVDSGLKPGFYYAYAGLGASLYPGTHNQTSLRNKVQVDQAGVFYVAKNSKVLATLTLFGSDTGTNIGARCNRLHANMSQWLALVSAKTDGFGNTANNLLGKTPLAYNNILAGLSLYWQGAWEDSKTKQLSLTIASKVVLPPKPNIDCYANALFEFYTGSGGSKSSPQGPYRYYAYNAVERYRRK